MKISFTHSMPLLPKVLGLIPVLGLLFSLQVQAHASVRICPDVNHGTSPVGTGLNDMERPGMLQNICPHEMFGHNLEANWETFYKDKNVTIEYRLAECTDKVNGLSVNYYVMRIRNQSDKRINLTYVLGEGDSSTDEITLREQENYCSLILQPGEILEAKCPNPERMLSLFVEDRVWSKQAARTKFVISKIYVYEI